MTRPLLLLAALAVLAAVAWAILSTVGGGSETPTPSADSPPRPGTTESPSPLPDGDDPVTGGTAPREMEPRSARVPDDPPPELAVAKAHFDLGEYRDALLALDRIIEKEPSNADALELRGRTQLNLGLSRPALRDLERSVEAGGETAARLTEYAWALHQMRRHDEAAQKARRAIELDPRAARAHSVLAAIHLFEGRRSEAEEEVSRALAIDPGESMAVALGKRLEIEKK